MEVSSVVGSIVATRGASSLRVRAWALLVLAGCSSGNSTVGSADASADSGVGSPDVIRGDAGAADGGMTDTPSAGGLTLATATTNVSSIELPATYTWEPPRTGATAVKFVAIVTHTAGRDAIAGGTLEDSTGATYAAFQLGSTNGTYSTELDWKAINDVRPIDTTPANDIRQFIVKFFDNTGNTVTKALPLSMRCGASGTQAAQNGVCHDLSLDGANCGTHGKTCQQREDTLVMCVASKCAAIPTFGVAANSQGYGGCVRLQDIPEAKPASVGRLFTRAYGMSSFHADTSIDCAPPHGQYFTGSDQGTVSAGAASLLFWVPL